MAQVPNTSEKEKTARLVESLSRHQQVELLAQALLREYMHRRGLHETLRTFDQENPRDERTISSRALMRQLLNIPVEGRPSRLQPTSSSAKPQAPTFMEELCSYRLTKRSYIGSGMRLGSEQEQDQEDDPSDVELRELHAAVNAQRAARALCEQRQREYEELLTAEEVYQRRKKRHKEKKHKSKDKGRRRDRHRSRGDVGSSDEEAESEGGDRNEGEGGKRVLIDLSSPGASRGAASTLPATRRSPEDTGGSANAVVVAVGSHWQPPASASPVLDAHHTVSDGVSSRSTGRISGRATQLAPSTDHGEDEVDPFGHNGANQQALMARIRAESERWPLQAHGGATNAHASSTSENTEGGDGPRSSLGAPHGALSALAGRDAGFRGSGSLSSTQPVGRTAAGLSPNSASLSSPIFRSFSATVPAGANGGVAALRMTGSPTPVPGASAYVSPTGLTKLESSGGFTPATRTLGSYSSILVKHVDALEESDQDAGNGRPLHSYDRTAVPRSSALAGSHSGSNTRTAVRSPSPRASILNESNSSVALHTPSRSPNRNKNGAGGSGGGSGLRHGIGFRTSTVCAESTTFAPTSPHGVADTVASAAKPSRKERRVKLLVD
ncbi:hypothetical protein JKF63_07512 [Porcisia hertigi]|uniref:MINDY4 N-terminal dimerisation domain-containing protein n=1 Tax=Porcisia hertigi TaxID=2761500 RepID=A0A836INX4_9TRYP|nr:hypothetical protein JKF63_07512 [Porcisia hertigi]